MIIRSYTAESVAGALKRVRSEMGGQAVVLKTRMIDVAGQKQFEVTACLDKPSVDQAGKTLVAEAKPQTSSAQAAPKVAVAERPVVPETASRVDLSEHAPKPTMTSTPAPVIVPSLGLVETRLTAIEAKLEKLIRLGIAPASQDPSTQEIIDELCAADMPESVALGLIDELKDAETEITRESVSRILTEKLDGMIAPDLNIAVGDRVLVLGPAGAGKTSVLGKLAADLVTEKKTKVRLTSLDSSKIGSIDELESYGALLGMTIDHAAADGSTDATEVLLIDSGVLPVAENDIANLKARINKLAPTHCLAVVSALTRAADLDKMVSLVASLGAGHLVITMTDLANGWGAVMSAAQNANLQIACVSNAPGGSGRLTRPDSAAIVTALLGTEAVRE